MPLLIDGHNLIGHLPDLSLSDPRDEVKLVARLQAYAARSESESPSCSILGQGVRRHRHSSAAVAMATLR